VSSSGDLASVADDAARELCSRIRAGNEAAFTSLYEAWFDRLMAFAMSATRRDDAFAADVVQQTFLRVIRGLPALSSAAALEAWMLTTTRRVAVDLLRAELARARRERAAGHDHRTSDAAAPATAPGREELAAQLAAAISALERSEHDALLVRVGEGLTLPQCAGALGISEGAVQGRVRRSLAKLRTILGGRGRGGRDV
jgi:RNA polymerase sigma-70 factor (ECF subfamily)